MLTAGTMRSEPSIKCTFTVYSIAMFTVLSFIQAIQRDQLVSFAIPVSTLMRVSTLEFQLLCCPVHEIDAESDRELVISLIELMASSGFKILPEKPHPRIASNFPSFMK